MFREPDGLRKWGPLLRLVPSAIRSRGPAQAESQTLLGSSYPRLSCRYAARARLPGIRRCADDSRELNLASRTAPDGRGRERPVHVRETRFRDYVGRVVQLDAKARAKEWCHLCHSLRTPAKTPLLDGSTRSSLGHTDAKDRRKPTLS